MPSLTTKELAALEDQIGIERMMSCKYKDAAGHATDATLKNTYQKFATQHEQNYTSLLSYLK